MSRIPMSKIRVNGLCKIDAVLGFLGELQRNELPKEVIHWDKKEREVKELMRGASSWSIIDIWVPSSWVPYINKWL